MIKWIQNYFIEISEFFKGKNSTLAWNTIIFYEDGLEIYKVSLSWCHHSLFCDDWSKAVMDFAFELYSKNSV